jgi:hypothetical protein
MCYCHCITLSLAGNNLIFPSLFLARQSHCMWPLPHLTSCLADVLVMVWLLFPVCTKKSSRPSTTNKWWGKWQMTESSSYPPSLIVLAVSNLTGLSSVACRLRLTVATLSKTLSPVWNIFLPDCDCADFLFNSVLPNGTVLLTQENIVQCKLKTKMAIGPQ